MIINNHKLVNTASASTQKIIVLKYGIGLQPLKTKKPNECIKGLLDYVTVEGMPFKSVQIRMSDPIVSITESFFDDFIKLNADFRYKAGLSPQITRIVRDKKACKWCKALAGVYNYADLPKNSDVFKRHENCHCQAIYKTVKYKQDIWSRKTVDLDDDYLQYYKSTVVDKNIYIYSDRAMRNVYKLIEYDNIYIADNVKIKPKQLHNINAKFNESLKILKMNGRNDKPNIFIINQSDMKNNAVGAYGVLTKYLYLIPELGNGKEFLKDIQNGVSCEDSELSTFIHELLHWKKSRDYIEKKTE